MTSPNSIDWTARAARLRPLVHGIIEGRPIDGEGEMLRKQAPRDGSVLTEFQSSSAAQVDSAVATARRAFEDGRWSSRSCSFRKTILHRLAALMEENLEEFALLEALDVGKTITDALTIDVPSAAGIIRMSAEMADKIQGDLYGADRSGLSFQLHRPVGVVGAVIGWNFPVLLAAQKIGPALATGNSVVLKPSELTPLSTTRIARLALEAGVPEGVLNVIHGSGGVGASLAHHPNVDLLTFTGSSSIGKQLLIASGESNMKRLVLECGGKAPNIVFDDCPDLDSVADGIVARAFWNQGQVCTASSRILLQEGIKERLLPLIIERTAMLRPQDPLKAESTFGALVSKAHRQKVLDYIAKGESEGASIAYRSHVPAPNENGFYVPPVIFEGVAPDSRIAKEEIFGPVLCVMSFRDEEDALRIANDTIYGLSAIVWTRSLERAWRLAHGTRAGWIAVNSTAAPPGDIAGGDMMSIGGHKQSGIGTEGGVSGMKQYLTSTAVQFCL